MNKCEVIVGITKKGLYEGYKEVCFKDIAYIVTGKDEPHFVFHCCAWHSHLFSNEKWDFKNV